MRDTLGDYYIRKVNSIGSLFGLIGALIMLGLMIFTVMDVLLRRFFNAPIVGGFEITEMTLVVMAFLAIPFAAAERVNVRVDLIVGRLSPKKGVVLDAITCFLSLGITAVLVWCTLPQVAYIRRIGNMTDMLRIPIYPFYIAVAFGLFLLFFILVGNFIEIARKWVKA